MSSKTVSGLYWHCHHNQLLEWVWDFEERRHYIETQKPRSERDLRLRLFQPVKGQLPVACVKAWQAYIEAGQAHSKAKQVCNEAKQAYDEVWQACDEAWRTCDEAKHAYSEAGRVCDEARRVYSEAWQTRNEAKQAYDKAEQVLEKMPIESRKEIEALHLIECPNCPWNGKTIFLE